MFRLGTALGPVITLLLICGPFLPAPNPILLTLILAIASVYLITLLLQFQRWNDELRHVLPRFIPAVSFLLFVVTVENFCTWATSASDMYKYSYTPLQDNAEIVFQWTAEHLPLFRAFVYSWKVDMHWLLYAFVALCLSVAWDQVPYSGFAIGARFIDTIAWSHALRTVAFMITVLPNPRLDCYARSFPPVPNTLWEFIAYGFSAKRGSGCNDLVISGHGVVYTAVPLALQTFYPMPWYKGGPALWAWAAVAKLCIQETLDKTHYSVDMLLAVAITALVWVWRAPIYPAGTSVWSKRRKGAPADPIPYTLVALVAGVLILVFVGVHGV